MSEENKKEDAVSGSKELETAEKSEAEIPEEVEESIPMPPEALKRMPPEIRKEVMSLFSMQGSFGPRPSPIDKKITSDHITALIDAQEKHDERSYNNAGYDRRYTLGYVVLGAIILVFFTVFLVQKDITLFKEFFKLLVAFAGGVGAGYGFKSFRTGKHE